MSSEDAWRGEGEVNCTRKLNIVSIAETYVQYFEQFGNPQVAEEESFVMIELERCLETAVSGRRGCPCPCNRGLECASIPGVGVFNGPSNGKLISLFCGRFSS